MVQNGASPQSAPADAADPLVGRVLNDKFRIVEVLGAGGMGRVYKAVQSPLERLVALKVLNPQYSEGKDPGFQKRFFMEAAVTSKLRHPNTVTIFDYGKTDDGVLYIAMEYLEGQTLANLLANAGALPWIRALNVVQQVARSLREAHKVGLIHRDLKPANIMILSQEDDHDLVKVLDFGLVKSFLPDRAPPQDVEITQAGVILGSPLYMAPEQARNSADPRSDVYSLGVVMYQMMLGRPPFVAPQGIDVIFKHINEAPPSFSSVWATHDVPRDVEALVMRCLSKRPEDRLQSMDEVLDAIRRAASAAGHSGAFATSRTLGNSGVMSAPAFGLDAHGSRTGPLPSPNTSGANTLSFTTPGQEPAPRRLTLPLALFAGSLLLGLGVAAALTLRAPAPGPVAVAPEPVAPPAPTPAPAPVAAAPAAQTPPAEEVEDELAPLVQPAGPDIEVSLSSEPPGATVMYQGRVLGETPLSLPLPSDAEGRANARLTFTLEGYQRATALVAGEGPVLRFHQKLLKKRSGTRPPADRSSSGYKDDPY
ncbi:serine/threonine-protein kinase [Archangium primigenium]|uniref:serine/threonine protein kinase n=1 Tax=[Archangium] primigenium TaxID=2792470 RepID=UPI0019562047|nr:serine/threonine-protein kinase [Archangium primigenium]MBM7113797.1 serine/threonine protein kinase [Archangium primigenium]